MGRRRNENVGIGWQATMETGAPVVDAGHRALVQRADALLDALQAGRERAVVERALRSFGDYAVRHFSRDEDCAMRGRCPALEWNAAGRAELIAIMAEFRRAFERGGATPALAEGLSAQLAAWVRRYIPGPQAASLPCVLDERQAAEARAARG
jgi:hemerythrin-like metal-binding protein